MKKLVIFTCLLVFLISGLSADGIFNGLNFELSAGAESFSVPVTIKEFDAFEYKFSYDDINVIYTLSLNSINAIEKQDRIFLMGKMSSNLCEIYGKIGALQFTEEMLGGLKVRWQDELPYQDITDYNYLEYVGNAMTSRPYNALFWAIGTKIHFFKNEKINFNINGEYSEFRIKKFYMDFLYNYEQNQWGGEDVYIDKMIVDFDAVRNQMLKLGMQVNVYGKNFSPWLNISYILYKTNLEGKYNTQYVSWGYESSDTQIFSTKSKLINTLLFSSGIKIKIAKNFEVEAFASLGALNGAGLSWIILL